jgi:hypothetical protein
MDGRKCLIEGKYENVTISGWDHLLTEYHRMSADKAGGGKGWIFRGEKSLSYCLSTSLEREVTGHGYPLDKMPELETKVFREFQRRLHHYTDDVPHKDDKVEWLALMQHYQGPTRLLDWTYSFFVALYFAIEKAETASCALWALKVDTFSLPGANATFTDAELEERDALLEKFQFFADHEWREQNATVEYLFTKPSCQVFAVNPFRLNERLTIQQGLFLMPGDISTTFETNLVNHDHPEFDLSKDLTRYVISHELRRDILLHLHRMNISRATLFPGLVGFAESLKTRLAFHELMSGKNTFAS